MNDFGLSDIWQMFCHPDLLAQRIEWRGAGKYAKVSRGRVICSSSCKYIVFFFFVFCFCFIKVNNELSQTCFRTSCELH